MMKLEVDSIYLTFRNKLVLKDVYIKAEDGLITGIIGRNGSGKSSLLKVIFGSLSANNKSIRLDDKVLNTPLFQEKGIINYLPQTNFMPKSLSIIYLFKDFGVCYLNFIATFPEFNHIPYNTPIGKLSGGERRLLEVYLITKSESKFTLLDEPFLHLTPIVADKIKEIIKEQKDKKGIILTDNIYDYVIKISDNLLMLNNGSILQINSAEVL